MPTVAGAGLGSRDGKGQGRDHATASGAIAEVVEGTRRSQLSDVLSGACTFPPRPCAQAVPSAWNSLPSSGGPDAGSLSGSGRRGRGSLSGERRDAFAGAHVLRLMPASLVAQLLGVGSPERPTPEAGSPFLSVLPARTHTPPSTGWTAWAGELAWGPFPSQAVSSGRPVCTGARAVWLQIRSWIPSVAVAGLINRVLAGGHPPPWHPCSIAPGPQYCSLQWLLLSCWAR